LAICQNAPSGDVAAVDDVDAVSFGGAGQVPPHDLADGFEGHS
jgi:hypothetical protein